MPEKYKNIIEHIPFLIGAVGHVKVNYTRLIEALIIAIMTAFGTSYMTVERLTIKYEALNDRVNSVEKTVDHLHPRGYPKFIIPKD